MLRFILGAVFLAVFIFSPLPSYSQNEVLTFYVGDLIRAEDDHKVYVLTKGGTRGKRRWIRNIEVFNSYNFKWEDVRVVPPVVLPVFEFTNLLRQEGDEKVYLISESGFKRHIPSPSVFTSYGFDWNDVAVVPSVEVESYPESRLIRKEGDSKVYLIENNTKRWIESAEVFRSQGFDWNEIQVVNNQDISFFQTGETITPQAPKVPPPAPEPAKPIEEPQEETQEEQTQEETTESVSATTTEPSSATTTEPAPEPIATVPVPVSTPTPSGGGGGGSPTPSADTTAPSAITDLSVSATATYTIAISWTEPGDDGSTGTATSYDIRYSTSNITDANWASRTQVSGEPSPQAAGTSQSMTTSGLSSGTTYYFAMKTSDEAGNESGLSNVVSGATDALPPPPDITAPSVIASLSVSNPTISSITLSWRAPGDDAYGGTATSYDIRYSTSNITDSNWASATQVTGEPTPQVAGTLQSMTISGLSTETTYYFAIKTKDEVPNESALSNVASRATKACVSLASGSQTYSVSSGSGQPQIQGITLDPLDFQSGSSQTVTVTARDTNNNAITSMNVTFTTDSGSNTISLPHSSGSTTSGTWSISWTPTDTHCATYSVTVSATSASGESSVDLSLQ